MVLCDSSAMKYSSPMVESVSSEERKRVLDVDVPLCVWCMSAIIPSASWLLDSHVVLLLFSQAPSLLPSRTQKHSVLLDMFHTPPQPGLRFALVIWNHRQAVGRSAV